MYILSILNASAMKIKNLKPANTTKQCKIKCLLNYELNITAQIKI